MKARFMKPTACAALAICLVASGAIAQQQPAEQSAPASSLKTPQGIPDQPNQVRGDEITTQCKDAVSKGLAFLAARQARSGAFAGQGGGYANSVALTSLAGLAFMEAGNLPGRGKYAKEIQHCVDYVLANCQDSGLIVSSDPSGGPMYGHGFSTLFLGEVYGMTRNDAIKAKLERAVQLIERCQNEEGGWRYQATPIDADLSVTICQVMGLRSAREAGIHVSAGVIEKAIQYVIKSQNQDGGFSYTLGRNELGGGSGFPRSAAGCCVLYYSGIFEGDNLKKGLDYVKRFTPGQGGDTSNGGLPHYFYGYYYATQAMFLAGGDYWSSFWPAIRDEIVQRQKGDHWEGEVSEDYSTAMALIILQMPNRYLPVFDASTGRGR